MIRGYKNLSEALDRRISPNCLAVRSCIGSLPLPVQWDKGQRVWLEADVSKFKESLQSKVVK